ncbi:zinc finger matrin-type protein 2-like [Mucor ambiguus]|uniref:Zinc finger matrin-type protein 2-like n=1 Tax=Mucor ambiguus TaxID=91626 RepID=A0A0C9N6W6_9FUNG|nr:zinc finger matrin-type protein 2-like [Mucor ambiguus]
MSAYGAGKAKDTDFRRTWNKEEYAAKAKARENRDRLAEKNDERKKLGLPPLKPKRRYDDDDESKEALKAREEKVDIESNVGKVQVVQAADSRKQPGFYCKACDITIKDSVTWIDHLNGRKHLNNVGVSSKVEKADLSSVKERLAMLKRKKENPQKEEYNLDERLAAIKQQEEDEKQKRREKKKQKKDHKKKPADEEDGEDEMAKLMGFSGFGSSKA